jgi:hypothetical protein
MPNPDFCSIHVSNLHDIYKCSLLWQNTDRCFHRSIVPAYTKVLPALELTLHTPAIQSAGIDDTPFWTSIDLRNLDTIPRNYFPLPLLPSVSLNHAR